MEGEIVSGMMEGETLQLALSQYTALHPCLHSVSVMITDNSVSSTPSPGEMPVLVSSLVPITQ